MIVSCRSCGVIDGSLITRWLEDPDFFSYISDGDDLSVSEPEAWGAAHRAKVTNHRCESCQGGLGLKEV